jgi:hypothetical protein
MRQPPAPLARDVASLFRQVGLLDRNDHRGWRVKALSDWSSARAINAVPLASAEFVEASRDMPIAFVPSSETSVNGRPQVLPIAMLGLRAGENLFVAPDGQWDGRFIPAALRRYPFGMLRTADDQLSMVVDLAYPGWRPSTDEADGEQVIDADGKPTEYGQRLLAFLERFEGEMQRTRLMCDRLVELDLLRGAEVSGALPGSASVKADGFFMVARLPDAEVLELHRNGMLGLLHLHMHSMGNVQQLADRIGRRQAH